MLLACTVLRLTLTWPFLVLIMAHVPTMHVSILLLPTYYEHMCICKMCLRCAGLVEDVEKPLRGKDTGQAPGAGMRGAAGIRLPWPKPRGLADTKESEPFTRIHLESGSNFGIRNGWSIGYIFCIKKN